METAHPPTDSPLLSSPRELLIGGISATVHGLSQLPVPSPSTPLHVTVIHLLHPRLAPRSFMFPLAAALLSANPPSDNRGTITVAIDQRNHGTRELEPIKNQAWREGNPTHAPDMFASYDGTARDLSFVIDYLPAYLFPAGGVVVDRHVAAGVSLGGHAAWSALLNEPRVCAAAIVIGCPDYEALMVDRARKSRLEGFEAGKCEAYPPGLAEVVAARDPMGVLKSGGEKELERRLRGKNVLVVGGMKDKLVPVECGKGFLDALRKVQSVKLVEKYLPEAGHEFPPEMLEAVVQWFGGLGV